MSLAWSRHARAAAACFSSWRRCDAPTDGGGATELGAALSRLGQLARERGLVTIVSDFRGPREWRTPLLQLAGRHDVLAVEIQDPREQELPDVGAVWLTDPETWRQLHVDTSSRTLRERFAAAAPSASPTPTAAQTPNPAAGDAAPTVILLLSDGANSGGRTEPRRAAEHAQQQGVPVFTIALGTQVGTLNLGGNRRMPVPPDERTLRQIAEITDGRFFSAPTEQDLRGIYQNLATRIGWVDQVQEVTTVFAAAALALLLAGGGLSLLLFNRFP